MSPRKSAPRLPVSGRFFFSLSDYYENSGLDPQFVDLWSRDAQGIWYCNGLKTMESEVPDDLCEVRMVQR